MMQLDNNNTSLEHPSNQFFALFGKNLHDQTASVITGNDKSSVDDRNQGLEYLGHLRSYFTYEDVAIVQDEDDTRMSEHSSEDESKDEFDVHSLSSSLTSLDGRDEPMLLPMLVDQQERGKEITTSSSVKENDVRPLTISYEDVAMICDSEEDTKNIESNEDDVMSNEMSIVPSIIYENAPKIRNAGENLANESISFMDVAIIRDETEQSFFQSLLD